MIITNMQVPPVSSEDLLRKDHYLEDDGNVYSLETGALVGAFADAKWESGLIWIGDKSL